MRKPLASILGIRSRAEEIASNFPSLMIAAEKIASVVQQGEHAQRKAGRGQKFWQFREYIAGDRPQDIDWRQSAKTDHIFIKQKEWHTTQRSYIWCASGRGMEFSSSDAIPSKKICAQTLCLALALLMTRGEEQVGFYGDIKTGRSENTLHKLAEVLSTPANENTLPNTSHFIPPAHSGLVLCGDFLSPFTEIESCFSKLYGQIKNAIIIQVLNPSELTLNYSGRVMFEGLENGHELVNSVDDIRAQYELRINTHIASLRDLCAAQGWMYILHDTSRDLTDTLRDVWMMTQSQGGRG